MLEYHIDYEHDVIRHLIIQEKRKIRYQQIMNFTRNLYHHCQYRRSRQSSNQTSNHLPLASIQGTSLSTQLSSMLPFLRPQSWLACVLLFWIFIFLSLISYCPVVSELSSPSTSSKVNEVINSDHQLSRIAYVNNGPSLTDIINSILAKERSLNNSLIQHQQVMVPSTTISPVTTESITESSRIPLEDSSTSIVPSTNKKHFVDPQTSLDCHRREYTFKASRTDAFGRKCWQYVKVMSCWGRCDSGEIGDWRFPFKKSYHPICGHDRKRIRRIRLKYCDDGVDESLRLYKIPEAVSCSCRICYSSNESCEGGLPHVQVNRRRT